VQLAVESGLEALIREEGDAAAERAEASWRANAAGRELVEHSREDLSRSSVGFPGAVARMIRDWQGAVLDLVADEGMSKRSQARFLALGVNGVGVALMIVVFAHTGGLVGAEVGVAGGTAVLAQRVLEAVFGDQAVRRLAETAKEDLDARIQALMADELLRYHAVLEALQLDAEQPDRLRAAAQEVQRARAGGLPTHSVEAERALSEPALSGADERLALEAPRLSQIDLDQALQGYPAGDVVDAEFVDSEPAAHEAVRRSVAFDPAGTTERYEPDRRRDELRPEDLR
jgi:hypothetical protein